MGPENACIRKTTLAELLKGDELRVDGAVCSVFPPDKVVRQAQCLAGSSRGDYDLVFYNCDHFTNWCVTGEMESKQVKKGLVIAVTAVTVLAVKALVDEGEEA
jgi:hypothetical protein